MIPILWFYPGPLFSSHPNLTYIVPLDVHFFLISLGFKNFQLPWVFSLERGRRVSKIKLLFFGIWNHWGWIFFLMVVNFLVRLWHEINYNLTKSYILSKQYYWNPWDGPFLLNIWYSERFPTQGLDNLCLENKILYIFYHN